MLFWVINISRPCIFLSATVNYCVTGVSITAYKYPYSELFWSAFFQHFPAFGLILSPYSVRMPENAGKMQTRITPKMDSFYAAYFPGQ